MRTQPKPYIAKEQWHQYFAWYPVKIWLPDNKATQWVWLETVLRRLEYHPFNMTNSVTRHYQLAYIK